MLVSVGLPTHRVDRPDEFVTGEAIAELARVAEEAGFGAVSVTDHPFPSDAWMAKGGHHALDPFVALSFAAAATSTIRLHTNLLVVAYRNPVIAAHGVATLDRLSGARVELGVGAGYLEAEFDALGADFANRNEVTDEAIRTMQRVWAGESVDGHTLQPTPVRPRIWIGGNSKRAVRRAVELADGWSPFPSPSPKLARFTRTAALAGAEDLRAGIAYAMEHAAAVGRTAPLEVMFMPPSLGTLGHEAAWDAGELLEEIGTLRAAGMTAMTVTLPGETRAALADALRRFGAEILAAID